MTQPGPSRKPKARKRLPSFNLPEGMTVEGSVTFKDVEARDEKKQRLWEKSLSFLVNDLLVRLVAISLVVAAGIWSLWTLSRSGSTEPDRQYTKSMLTSLITGVLAYIFGKASK